MSLKVVESFFKPTNLDKEPFGTRWVYVPEQEVTEEAPKEQPMISYVQISKDADKPIWVLYGNILENAITEMQKELYLQMIDVYNKRFF